MLQKLFAKRVSRKDFLKLCVSLAAVLSLSGLFGRKAGAAQSGFNGRAKKDIRGDHDLVVSRGDDPYAMTVKGVEAMGGMGRFVKPGAVVVIKPNIGWDRSPEQAGNTNPAVIAALVDMAFKAGAKRVNVFDITCHEARRCYATSGIESRAKASGANVYFPDDWDTVKAQFGYKSRMEGWPVLRDAVECDTFINVPVLKHHSLARLTISMKNLMGVCAGNRSLIHQDLGEKLVDLTEYINPELTVVDAYRVLMRNGPSGGSLADVEAKKTIIVGTDPTLADAYSARLVDVDPMRLSSIAAAVRRNFGSVDIGKADILTVEA